LSYLANTQTDRQTSKQTKSGKNITSLAEVIIIICVGERNHVTLTVGTKVPWKESTWERKFHLWNFRSWERKYVGTKVP